MSENEQKISGLRILTAVFIILSAVHILYATLTWRGLYEDGAFYAAKLLNNLAANNYTIAADPGHPRTIMMFLVQFPVWILNFLHIDGKNILLTVFSLSQFIAAPIFLIWHYFLSKRTKKTDIFFWHLFVYCLAVIPYSIFSVTESIIGFGMHFILWNYLVSDINYKKRDITGIVFLLICMFQTYEYVVFLGFIIFIFHFMYVIKSDNLKSQVIKSIIGFGSLAASIYNIVFMLNVEGESDEISRFLEEGLNWIPNTLNLCIAYSFFALLFMLFIFFIKNKEYNGYLIFCGTILGSVYYFNLCYPEAVINPMWEQHIRFLPCVLIPLIFIIMPLQDIFKPAKDSEKHCGLLSLVLSAGVFQLCHQINDTYWWSENIKYMKSELEFENSRLYIPSEHRKISDFYNENMRIYIWHGVYPATSILFSNDYELKTLLMNYDEPVNDCNPVGREFLYTNLEENKMSIPFGAKLSFKNKFWDITECAKALDKHNKENNIKTYGDG